MRAALFAVTLLAAGASAPAQAAGLDIALGNDTADIVFLTNTESIGFGGADLGFGVFFNDDDDVIGTANLLVTGQPARQSPWQLGAGAKAFLGDLDSGDEGGAIGLGGQARYVLPTAIPTALAFEGYFAPSVTSFSDFDDVTDLNARFEVEVAPSAQAYVGYRNIDIDIDDGGDREAADELQVGVRFVF